MSESPYADAILDYLADQEPHTIAEIHASIGASDGAGITQLLRNLMTTLSLARDPRKLVTHHEGRTLFYRIVARNPRNPLPEPVEDNLKMKRKPPKRKRSPWFAFYPDDFAGGTRGMSMAAKGAFVDLLAYQFANGSIPNDDRTISRIIGAFPDEWESVRSEVLPKFEQEGVTLVNRRMQKEREEREEIRGKRVDAINKRWSRRNTNEDTNVIQVNQVCIPFVSGFVDTSSASASSSSSTKDLIEESKDSSPVATSRSEASKLASFESFWQEYPKKRGKGDAEKSWLKVNPSLPAVLAAIEWQRESKDWLKDQGQFIPNPATYINQRRWMDEPTTTRRSDAELAF